MTFNTNFRPKHPLVPLENGIKYFFDPLPTGLGTSGAVHRFGSNMNGSGNRLGSRWMKCPVIDTGVSRGITHSPYLKISLGATRGRRVVTIAEMRRPSRYTAFFLYQLECHRPVGLELTKYGKFSSCFHVTEEVARVITVFNSFCS